MRRILASLFVLVMLLSSAAFAEVPWVEIDFTDFTMSIPEDILGSISEEIVANEPFFMLYQDYDPNAFFSKNLNGVWNETVTDLASMDPAVYGNAVMEASAAGLQSIGIGVSGSTLLAADHDEHDGKPALSIIYVSVVDYSAYGGPSDLTLYTLQAQVSDEAFGSYTFTISTDDLENTQLLMEILETISWTK